MRASSVSTYLYDYLLYINSLISITLSTSYIAEGSQPKHTGNIEDLLKPVVMESTFDTLKSFVIKLLLSKASF
jgi:hypothetical protein